MMYLQITTKCNFKCAHCCYSCNMKGRHMDWGTAVDAIRFAGDNDSEGISIGGGEPTLHPRFFDILAMCLDQFDNVWMATNGSKTKMMMRLSNIIDGCDYPEDVDPDNETAYDIACDKCIFQDGKLSVALSQDYYHPPIDERVARLWRQRAGKRNGHYEIRDVSASAKGVVNAGRAKRTQVGQDYDGCVCSDLFIRPDGRVKLCGCKDAPVIGDIHGGIDAGWLEVMQEDEGYRDYNCHRKIGRKPVAA